MFLVLRQPRGGAWVEAVCRHCGAWVGSYSIGMKAFQCFRNHSSHTGACWGILVLVDALFLSSNLQLRKSRHSATKHLLKITATIWCSWSWTRNIGARTCTLAQCVIQLQRIPGCLSFFLSLKFWSSHCGAVEINLTSIHEDVGLIPGLAQWVKDLVLLWTVV